METNKILLSPQVLPWFVRPDRAGQEGQGGEGAGTEVGCVRPEVVEGAVREALRDLPPLLGVDLDIRLPPKGGLISAFQAERFEEKKFLLYFLSFIA